MNRRTLLKYTALLPLSVIPIKYTKEYEPLFNIDYDSIISKLRSVRTNGYSIIPIVNSELKSAIASLGYTTDSIDNYLPYRSALTSIIYSIPNSKLSYKSIDTLILKFTKQLGSIKTKDLIHGILNVESISVDTQINCNLPYPFCDEVIIKFSFNHTLIY